MKLFSSLVAGLLVVGVFGSEDDHDHEEMTLEEDGYDMVLEKFNKTSLGEEEVEELILSLTGGVDHYCPSAHAVLNASGIEEGNVASTRTEVEKVLANLYPCITTLIVTSTLNVTHGEESYVCHVEVEEHGDHRRLSGDDHDDHDHEEKSELTLKAGSLELHCDAVEKPEEAENEFKVDAAIWGKALGATAIACAASLIGVVLVFLGRKALSQSILNDVTALAIGVLLSTVFVHMLPESVELYGTYDWKVGATFLGGIFCALTIEIVSSMLGHSHEHEISEVSMKDVDDVEEGPAKKIDYSLVVNVVLGDGMHNLTDGMLIGIAFSFCGSSNLGWIVLAAVLAHELPQELIDFVILIRAGLSPKMALFYNFLSSCAAFIGCILVLGLGETLTSKGHALLLAFGSGFLVYIALAELVPSIVTLDSKNRKVGRLFLVVLGIIGIGLLQLFHEHCEAGHGHSESGHEGHGH